MDKIWVIEQGCVKDTTQQDYKTRYQIKIPDSHNRLKMESPSDISPTSGKNPLHLQSLTTSDEHKT